jgi:hypothetical protein
MIGSTPPMFSLTRPPRVPITTGMKQPGTHAKLNIDRQDRSCYARSITFRLTYDEAEAIERLSYESNRPISDLMRRAVRLILASSNAADRLDRRSWAARNGLYRD